MGECASPPTTRQPSALSPRPSGGEAARIFEMCFDHRSSQRALILYWPKMKGIRCKSPLWKAISIYRWCFVCLLFSSFRPSRSLHPLKRGHLDIIKRSIPKRKALGLWCFSNVLLGRSKTLEQRVCVQNIHESLSSASLLLRTPRPTLSAKKRNKKTAFATKQMQTADNE